VRCKTPATIYGLADKGNPDLTTNAEGGVSVEKRGNRPSGRVPSLVKERRAMADGGRPEGEPVYLYQEASITHGLDVVEG
jgi:hypothetical protein